MEYNGRKSKEKGNEGNRTTVIEEGMYRDSRFDNRTQWLGDGHKRKKKVSCLRTHEKKMIWVKFIFEVPFLRSRTGLPCRKWKDFQFRNVEIRAVLRLFSCEPM